MVQAAMRKVPSPHRSPVVPRETWKMRMVRWFMCKMEIKHRVRELWLPLEESGLNRAAVIAYGCEVSHVGEQRFVNYFECVDCLTKIAPFEVAKRGWKPLEGNRREGR